MSTLDIAYRDIDERYAVGKLGDFEVIIRKKDRYLNGSKLVQQAGREYKTWKRAASTREYIREVARENGLSEDELLDTVRGGDVTDRAISGTYVHPDLIIHMAQWCSASFCLRTNRILQDYFNQEARQERRRLRDKMRRTKKTAQDLKGRVKRRDKKIDRLESMMREMMSRQERSTNQTNTKLEVLQEDVTHVRGELTTVSRRLGVAKNQRVPPAESPGAVHHTIVLRHYGKLKKSQDDNSESEEDLGYPYSCLRVQKTSIASCLANKRQQYPEAEIILDVVNPNSMNVWRRYRERYGEYISSCGIDFALMEGYSESRMLRHINRIISSRHQEADLR